MESRFAFMIINSVAVNQSNPRHFADFLDIRSAKSFRNRSSGVFGRILLAYLSTIEIPIVSDDVKSDDSDARTIGSTFSHPKVLFFRVVAMATVLLMSTAKLAFSLVWSRWFWRHKL